MKTQSTAVAMNPLSGVDASTRLEHIEGRRLHAKMYESGNLSWSATIKYTENLKHLLQGGFIVYRRALTGDLYKDDYLILDPQYPSKPDTKAYHRVHLEGEQVVFTQIIADA